jgi:hypothetical protein
MMPGAAEKQRRKELAQRAKQADAALLRASLPVSVGQLQALFNHLDNRLAKENCDDTLRHTQQFATATKLPYEALKSWLATLGGYCDCEVLANVEEKIEGLT